MSKTFKRISLLSIIGGSAYYAYNHRDELITFITDKKVQLKADFSDYQNDISRVTNSSKKMQYATDHLNTIIEETLPIVDSISNRIEKFTYEIEPNINKINKKLEKYQ